MSEVPRKNAGIARGRPFAPGNPGRPHGTRHRITRAVEELLAGEHEKLSRKAIELALKGDTVALRLCLDRIAPARRDAPVSIALPPVTSAEGLVAAGGVVAAALAAGELTPEEAARTMAVLQAQRQILETSDLAQRIAALEAGEHQPSAPAPLPAQPVALPEEGEDLEPGTIEIEEPRRLTLNDPLSDEERRVLALISLQPPSTPGDRPTGSVRANVAPLDVLQTLAERGLLEIFPVRNGFRRILWTDVGARWREAMK
jgi:hypothetical protein